MNKKSKCDKIVKKVDREVKVVKMTENEDGSLDVVMEMPEQYKEVIEENAKKANMTVNEFINQLILEKVQEVIKKQ